jgi:hypothetical protein
MREKKSPEKIRIEKRGAQNQKNRKLKYYKYTLFIALTIVFGLYFAADI